MRTCDIDIIKRPKPVTVITTRNITVRERVLRFLLGAPIHTTVIVPGDTVERVTINDTEDEE